jgi:hypothetical protein
MSGLVDNFSDSWGRATGDAVNITKGAGHTVLGMSRMTSKKHKPNKLPKKLTTKIINPLYIGTGTNGRKYVLLNDGRKVYLEK